MTEVSGELFCDAGDDVRLCYQTFGDPADPVCLLVMGLGYQMIAWPDEFCEQLACRGLHVIRFDNRDSGRSTHLRHLPSPAPLSLFALAARRARPGYTLGDMAADAAGLLDRLGIEQAHVVGVSMGGMIAQTLAARRPERVRSLTSIMSTTGNLLRGLPSPRVFPFLFGRLPEDRESYVEQAVRLNRVVRSPGFAADERALRAMLERNVERGITPAGFARQLGAVVAAGDRTRELARITAPTLVIHGTEDRMIAPSGGRATARAIPGAKLLLIDGMGHDLPAGLWPRILDAVTGNAARAS